MKWVLRGIGALCVTVMLLIRMVVLIPTDLIVKIAADQISAATGRDMTIDGAGALSLWPVLGVKIGRIEIANADWAGDAQMFAADGLSIAVDVVSLWSGVVQIKRLRADGAVLSLRQSTDG